MPIKYNNISNSGGGGISGYSVLFNGSTQYLTVPSGSDWAFGTGDFTVEWWQNMTTQNSNPRVFSVGTWPSAAIAVSIEGGTFYVWENSSYRFSYSLTAGGYLNQWIHFAVSRTSATTRVFKNGTQIGSSYSDTNNISNTTTKLAIGQESTGAAGSYFTGRLTDFRILKGTGLYTASFTAPVAPLTAITNTVLLTCNASTIIDSSPNNYTITNVNGATVTTIIPFATGSAVLPKIQFKNRNNNTLVSRMGFIIPSAPFMPTQRAMFAFGSSLTNVTNLVSNTGVVANDVSGVGTARTGLAGAGYGTDKAIFGYGMRSGGSYSSLSNTVSNVGVLASDTTGVGTARQYLAAAGYGTDKAIFGFGYNSTLSPVNINVSNLVSNTGVVASNSTGVGYARHSLAAAGYGTDKAIFAYGYENGFNNYILKSNLVSNTGVVATDTTIVGTARFGLAAAGYGSDTAIFGYGRNSSGQKVSITNKVSNTGVIATDTTGVGTAREYLAAASYGGNKSIFGYGDTGSSTSITNLVSNTGVVATDTAGVGTIRSELAAAGYSLT